jgi:hypothetical protein
LVASTEVIAENGSLVDTPPAGGSASNVASSGLGETSSMISVCGPLVLIPVTVLVRPAL